MGNFSITFVPHLQKQDRIRESIAQLLRSTVKRNSSVFPSDLHMQTHTYTYMHTQTDRHTHTVTQIPHTEMNTNHGTLNHEIGGSGDYVIFSLHQDTPAKFKLHLDSHFMESKLTGSSPIWEKRRGGTQKVA